MAASCFDCERWAEDDDERRIAFRYSTAGGRKPDAWRLRRERYGGEAQRRVAFAYPTTR